VKRHGATDLGKLQKALPKSTSGHIDFSR